MMLLQEIHGHSYAKRALEIALTGGHSLLFLGPEASGKSCLIEAASVLEGGSVCVVHESRSPADSPLPFTSYDMCCDIQPVSAVDMLYPPTPEAHGVVSARIARARAVIPEPIMLDDAAKDLLLRAQDRMHMSPTSILATVRVAGTLQHMARMEGTDRLPGILSSRLCVAEALVYCSAANLVITRTDHNDEQQRRIDDEL